MDYLQKYKSHIATGVVCFGLGGLLLPKILSRTMGTRRHGSNIRFAEEQLLKYVLEHATRNDPDSVLRTIDEYGWKNWLMNLGDVKGKIIDKALADAVASGHSDIVVELGGYCGYSAIRLARNLPDNSQVYSFEVSHLYAAIATKIIEFAGYSNKVKVIVGSSTDLLSRCSEEFKIDHIDVLFIDHWKELYLPDIKHVETLNLLRPGSVVIADNIICPGAPDYRAYMEQNQAFTSELVMSKLEYNNVLNDAVMISIKK
eukprot:TRINITY_DN1981_c0_g6_i1.p1 TRINITY_DN1981_c0_g6~~TRINITY_DN1981_c0_g6_i1.p1  ORF type:complete len:258 (+),score=84.50 TRINITY_DN1981_c0_g6_i1:58-831(+)